MATEAFALSPISARAAEPNEADYEAIREAFMETARGRWFLGEYAKRNRNADTSMVLDAVARIEETLAAQRQPVVEDRLPEALVAIRRAVGEAEAAAGIAFDRTAIEATLGPIHRGVRIIKEISWRWREIGADGRICDLIDSQLKAIEGACEQIATIDPRAELKAAFDLLKDQIEQTGADNVAPPQAAATVRSAPAQEAPEAAEAPPVEEPTATVAGEPSVTVVEMPQEAAAAPEVESVSGGIDLTEVTDVAGTADIAEVAECQGALEPSMAEPAVAAEMTEELPADTAAEAEDQAILDMVALEMAAPDPEFDEVIAEQPAAGIVAPAPVGAPIDDRAATTPVSEAVATAQIGVAVMERPAPEVAEAAPLRVSSPVQEPSLGSTILASGMLQKPRAASNDPLAPIRRMTQAEKIAFFS